MLDTFPNIKLNTFINSILYHTIDMPDQVKFYVKENVSQHEYEIHSYVYNLGIVNVPRIIEYDPFTKRMVMDRVGELNISDFYGEKAKHIEPELFDRIRVIIQKLYDHNILYIDITGYNFIETDNELWIIDFDYLILIF